MIALQARRGRRQNKAKSGQVIREKVGFTVSEMVAIRREAEHLGKSRSRFISEAAVGLAAEAYDLRHMGLVRMPGQIDTDSLDVLASIAGARGMTVEAQVMWIVRDWMARNPSEQMTF